MSDCPSSRLSDRSIFLIRSFKVDHCFHHSEFAYLEGGRKGRICIFRFLLLPEWGVWLCLCLFVFVTGRCGLEFEIMRAARQISLIIMPILVLWLDNCWAYSDFDKSRVTCTTFEAYFHIMISYELWHCRTFQNIHRGISALRPFHPIRPPWQCLPLGSFGFFLRHCWILLQYLFSNQKVEFILVFRLGL